MNTLPVQRASQLASAAAHTQWLVEGLWSEQAVGILGGEPKCCKSFLALDLAVGVASGVPCLRHSRFVVPVRAVLGDDAEQSGNCPSRPSRGDYRSRSGSAP